MGRVSGRLTSILGRDPRREPSRVNSIPLLVALAVGPGLLLVHAIYAADRNEKEPIRNLMRYALAGALIGVPAGLIEAGLVRIPGLHGAAHDDASFLALAASVLLSVALVEESAKRLAVAICARRDHEIDEPFDWIVYSVAVALGFATFENLLYVLRGGVAVALVRAITAVPAHALTGTLMGDRLAKAALATGRRARRNRWLAVVEPTLWHAAYDLLAVAGARAASRGEIDLASVFGASLFGLVAALWIVAVRHIRAMQRITAAAGRVPPILFPNALALRPKRTS